LKGLQHALLVIAQTLKNVREDVRDEDKLRQFGNFDIM
jgi:hypothetical protein